MIPQLLQKWCFAVPVLNVYVARSSAPSMNGSVIVDGRRVVDTEAASAAGLRVVALGVEVTGSALHLAD